MSDQLTRREALGVLGLSGIASTTAFAEGEVTKKEFMEESINNVRNNGFKFERTNKMKFEIIPDVEPFVDWDYYYLKGRLLWVPNPGQKFAPVAVPRGFVTDLASVPQFLWSVFPKTGRYAYAAIVHDYLYWEQSRSREDADKILVAAMEDAKVPSATIASFSAAIMAGGNSAWNSNAAARAAGEKRILAVFPDSKLVSWAEWRAKPGVFQ